MTLTKFRVKDVLRNQRCGLLKKKIAKFGLEKKISETSYEKKKALKKVRANLSDFERFRVMILKKRVTYKLFRFLSQ